MSILGMTAASESGAQQSDDVYVTPSSTVVSPPSTTPPEVRGTSTERSVTAAEAPVAVKAASATNSAEAQVKGTSLARTGQSTMLVFGIGLAAVVIGGFMLALRRRALPAD